MPPSTYAVTGRYFYDEQIIEIAAGLKPPAAGNLELTGVTHYYPTHDSLSVETLGRGVAWLGTGPPETLLQTAEYKATIEVR
jgi:glucose-1-phosphate thymidylyltransferase